MEFDEYQRLSRKTVRYPRLGPHDGPYVGWIYPALGLAGEAGEVEERVKKMIRDSDLQVTSDLKDKIRKELGDVLWYVSQLATELGMSLDDIATCNLGKLDSRTARGVIGGEGDDR